ncbi:hypothetical protein [Verrucomicrobium sp. BvORR106]|uniref:hypothetical protein n=1 Tax=Verrucomicrobium sp. BvORR106 TaxID=1403819 RepID=UPI0005708D72|nr:hypothetical protein [Verrucomicrobium sp. BvORR106]
MLACTLPLAAATPAPAEPWKTSSDPVAKLWQRVQSGQVKLPVEGDEKTFLNAVLKELDVPVASQVLVFSKTSLQNALIGPMRPRAVYFSEEVYVGWVQGGMIEIIGMDPETGPHFYTLSQRGGADAPHRPELATDEQCLSCHESSRTGGVKGLLVRSVFADASGQPILSEGSHVTTHESPLSERWGGWYVTGRHGKDRHMGNAIAKETGAGVQLDRERGANLTSLQDIISTQPYLTKTSDLVALMVLEHQCSTHNLLTDAAGSTRAAMARQRDLQKAFNEPITDVPQGSAQSVVRSLAEKLLRQMLFVGEYTLQDDGVEGDPAFQDAFRRNRRETEEGRSLKDFQLRTRLFKHRCSYMIYSQAFEALPRQMKDEFYSQLWQILRGHDGRDKEFASLSESERTHIRTILLATKKDLPACWREQTP